LLIDIRWHLLSIIGVFLALGIGMLIGTQIAQSGALEAEQLRLAERLEASLTSLRSENRSLREEVNSVRGELAQERAFADLVLGSLASGALQGMTIDVYVPYGQEATVERLLRLLTEAGAQARLLAEAPPAELAGSAAVVFWGGRGGVAEAAIPAGAVVAVPGAGVGVERLAQRADVIAAVDTPLGLLALVERLRTGAAPKDAAELVKERLAR